MSCCLVETTGGCWTGWKEAHLTVFLKWIEPKLSLKRTLNSVTITVTLDVSNITWTVTQLIFYLTAKPTTTVTGTTCLFGKHGHRPLTHRQAWNTPVPTVFHHVYFTDLIQSTVCWFCYSSCLILLPQWARRWAKVFTVCKDSIQYSLH